MTWSDEMTARFRELYKVESLQRYEDIAIIMSFEFGVTLTKNAMIGRANRLNLPSRAFKQKRAANPSPPKPRKFNPKLAPKPEPRKRPNGGVTLFELGVDECHFPYSTAPLYTYCAAPVRRGKRPYCDHHIRIMYQWGRR